MWSKRFGDSAYQAVDSLAVDAAGNVLVSGTLKGTIDFGGGPLVAAGVSDVFVVKLDSAGNHLWSKRFGAASSYEDSTQIAVSSAGDVAVTGSVTGTVDFGGGPLVGAGGGNAFVIKLDAAGTHLWSRRFGNSNSSVVIRGVAFADPKSLAITGNFDGIVDFGGGPLSTGVGGTHTFLAKLRVP